MLDAPFAPGLWFEGPAIASSHTVHALLRPLLVLVLAASAGCSSMSIAPRPTAEAPPSATTTAKSTTADHTGSVDRPASSAEADEAIESTRRTVRSTAEWLARGVDRWFGDKPFEEGGSVRDGSLRLSVFKRQTEKVDVDLRFRARFRLPNIEEKTYLFLGRDDRDGNIADRPGVLSEAERSGVGSAQSPSFFAGLGRSLGDLFDLRIGFRGVKPYAQARLQKEWQLGERSFVEFRETLFWTSRDRFGSTTALSWEWEYNSSMAVRWVSAATITQDVPDFAWSSVLGGYRTFGNRRLLAVEALASGQQHSGLGPKDYGAQVRWTQPIYSHWLLGEVLVGRFWLRTDVAIERQPVWAFGTALKMEF